MSQSQESFHLDNAHKTEEVAEPSAATKVNRRKRIEEMLDEKRLQKELCEYEWS
jgi:hypothetical protein